MQKVEGSNPFSRSLRSGSTEPQAVSRSAIARALRRLVEAARRRERNRFCAQIPLREDEILASEALILTLADELEHEAGVSPSGVILADRLITDGHSPVYGPTPVHDPPEATWIPRSSTPGPVAFGLSPLAAASSM
jgi:hypothetical protein